MNLDYSQRLYDIPWQNIKLIIFDLDGTLYNLAKFQQSAMFFIEQLKDSPLDKTILLTFFSLIDQLPGLYHPDLENFLYLSVGEQLNVENTIVKDIIDAWHELLLPLLPQAKLAYAAEFFHLVAKQSIKKIIYSNVPVRSKLTLLELEVDWVVTSFDKNINKLKPTSIAIKYIINKFNVKNENCLLIGDQYKLDGISAIEANIPFVILPQDQIDLEQFYSIMIKSYKAKMAFSG